MKARAGDFDGLREALGQVVTSVLASCTHKDIPDACAFYGLPKPPDDSASGGLSKAERIRTAWSEVKDDDLVQIAQRFIEHGGLGPTSRNQLQDLLWGFEDHPVLNKKIRRDVAKALSGRRLWADWDGFVAALADLWDTSVPLWSVFPNASEGQGGLLEDVERHMRRNDDWDAADLFKRVGAFDASDRRFGLWLEALASGGVLADAGAQAGFARAVNPALRPAGVALEETGAADGYPLYALVGPTRPKGKPKNIIFASTAKPDLRFRDAVDNDVEILGGAGRALVYDGDIDPGDGLTWDGLEEWWARSERIADPVEAKRSLWGRLLDGLPAETESPPQLLFFKAYHRVFGADVRHLPALLPEVWLFWDPKTVKQRGRDALLRFRMDFLMIAPKGRRIVFEVDGRQHYSRDGLASPEVYANTVRSDRELRLSGYEVYRFGAAELSNQSQAEATVGQFFQELFATFGITVRPATRHPSVLPGAAER